MNFNKQYYVVIVNNGDQKRRIEKYCEKHDITHCDSNAWLQISGDLFGRTISMVTTPERFDKLMNKFDFLTRMC